MQIRIARIIVSKTQPILIKKEFSTYIFICESWQIYEGTYVTIHTRLSLPEFVINESIRYMKIMQLEKLNI
jgi:hypothetical protein